MAVTMPMFPLGTVLVPGAVLPLHVFEPRYRAMVADCLAAEEPEFGVVLIERGFEVGGGDVRRAVATVARIASVGELDDGRYELVTHGTRRIRIVSWLPDAPYPRAEVEDWPEPEPTGDLAPQRDAAVRQLRSLLALASELGLDGAPDPDQVAHDPVVASYHLAAIAPIGSDDRYRLLAAPDAEQRYTVLDGLFAEVADVLRFRLQTESGDPFEGLGGLDET